MFGALLLLFTVVPALEIYLMFKISDEIGGLNTIAVIIITGIIGASLAKAQGLAVLGKIQNELSSGQIPASQITHALLVFGGGLLLLTPGFITDLLGLSMVFPGSRHIIAAYLKRFFAKSIQKGTTQFHFYKGSQEFTTKGQTNHFEQNQHKLQREVSPGTFEAEFTKNKD